MAYSVTADADFRTVVVHHEDPMGDKYLQSREELIDLVLKTGYRRVLVRIDGPGFGPDAVRIHDHISYLAMRLPNGVSMAVVMQPGDEDTTSVSLVEVVGGNRGLNIKVFEDEDHARAWLEQRTSNPQEQRIDP